jgi:competence protein ComEA
MRLSKLLACLSLVLSTAVFAAEEVELAEAEQAEMKATKTVVQEEAPVTTKKARKIEVDDEAEVPQVTKRTRKAQASNEITEVKKPRKKTTNKILTGTVNINTATVRQLSQLHKISQMKAVAIVEHREANGPFRSINDLLQVKGIGKGILELNRQYIVLE